MEASNCRVKHNSWFFLHLSPPSLSPSLLPLSHCLSLLLWSAGIKPQSVMSEFKDATATAQLSRLEGTALQQPSWSSSFPFSTPSPERFRESQVWGLCCRCPRQSWYSPQSSSSMSNHPWISPVALSSTQRSSFAERWEQCPWTHEHRDKHSEYS